VWTEIILEYDKKSNPINAIKRIIPLAKKVGEVGLKIFHTNF
jgi:hypothetical protein